MSKLELPTALFLGALFVLLLQKGRLPIHRAIADEHMLRLFTENRCCDLNLQDNEGRTALVLAVQAKNVQAVRQLFNAGADPAIPDKEKKWNACHWAARLDEELVLALLPAARGRPACLDAPDNKGNTPLLLAAEWGFAANVRLLAQAGANLHARNQLGRTAIHIASACAGSAALAAVLSQSTADLNVQDNDRSTALMIATQKPIRPENINLLLGAHADLSPTNNKGRTALHLAAFEDYHLLLQLVTAATPDTINLQDEDGNTALMPLLASPSFVSLLCHEGRAHVLRPILAHGADASIPNKVRETAPILARRRGWEELAVMMEENIRERRKDIGRFTKRALREVTLLQESVPVNERPSVCMDDLAVFLEFTALEDPGVQDDPDPLTTTAAGQTMEAAAVAQPVDAASAAQIPHPMALFLEFADLEEDPQ
eukprot:m.126657 g.126657  ORF g.126657 m.126657 type:complete len:430 (-) comp52238_c0_seq21:85-1374(-)